MGSNEIYSIYLGVTKQWVGAYAQLRTLTKPVAAGSYTSIWKSPNTPVESTENIHTCESVQQHTIHFYKCLYIYMYIYIYMYTVYIYVYIYMCVPLITQVPIWSYCYPMMGQSLIPKHHSQKFRYNICSSIMFYPPESTCAKFYTK